MQDKARRLCEWVLWVGLEFCQAEAPLRLVSCRPGEQSEELVASAMAPSAPGLGSNIGHLQPDELRERGPELGPLAIVLLLLFRSPHLQVRLPACLQKKRAAQGKKAMRGHCLCDVGDSSISSLLWCLW